MDYKSTQHFVRSFLIAMLLFPGVVYSVAAEETANVSVEERDRQLFAQAFELSAQEQWSEAEPIYRDLLKRNAEWPEPKNNLAILLLKTNRMDEAKQMFEQAVTSTPSYRIAQKNRTQLYNFLATQAYGKALGNEQVSDLPAMDLIEQIHLPVQLVEKVVEKIVEKKVEVIVEKPVPALPPSQPETVTTENVLDSIEGQLLTWSKAWSDGNFDQYIRAYSENFEPFDQPDKLSEWKNIRKAKLKYGKDVKVTVTGLRVYIEEPGDRVLAEFIQLYKSATYSDKVLKQLHMQKAQDNWLILSERVIKTF